MCFKRSFWCAVGLWLACLPVVHAGAWLTQGRDDLDNNRFRQAAEKLARARMQETTPLARTRAIAWLGISHFYMQQWQTADTLLSEALATELGSNAERARWLATRAELAARAGQSEIAEHDFQKATGLVRTDPDAATAMALARSTIFTGTATVTSLQALQPRVAAIRDRGERLRAWLQLGTQSRPLGRQATKLAFTSLSAARQLADTPRARAEVLNQLAQLYEDQRRWDDASRLNDQAYAHARLVDARDVLLEIDWRGGRLYRQQGASEQALAAYQRTVADIEALKLDIPVDYRNGRSSFRETLEPVYLGLADLLLQKATHATPMAAVVWLRRAREAVESLKRAELDDYLGKRCSTQRYAASQVDTIAPQTAVIYPIILPDRLEVLASAGTDFRQSTQLLDRSALTSLVRRFASSLRRRHQDAEALGNELYTWLMKPLEPWLRAHRIQTLVIVPDGVLRLIPLAALHDGERYLIERYAVVTSPGLTLMQPSPPARRDTLALLAGLSEPGPVIEQLPPELVHVLLGQETQRGGGGGTSRALPPASMVSDSKSQDVTLNDAAVRSAIREQLRLPGVLQELESLKGELPSTQLLDQNFTADALRQDLRQRPYSIVHIASHGVLGQRADQSFILAYDRVLTLDDLERLLQTGPFRDRPMDLLTLSACQTAEGDDRAPLGIAGMALKTRVRGALGTLWPVDDDAAARLMPAFYRSLGHAGLSKGSALQKAQLNLLHDPELSHPYFWAPFILVGNWL